MYVCVWAYKVDEGHKYSGVLRGCVCGCLYYWLCCQGLWVLWCEQSSKKIHEELSGHEDKV